MFEALTQRQHKQGISIPNIEYAINAVKDGVRREHILENLTADYRGMSQEQGNALLEDIYNVSGGEFKKENRGGYVFGGFMLVLGLSAAFYIVYVLYYGGVIIRPILVALAALVGLTVGTRLILKSLKGQYRDDDRPFDA